MEPSRNQVAKMIYLIMQIGFTVIVTIFLCIGLGLFIKKQFGIDLMLFLIILGTVSGFRAAYILIRKFVSFENPDDELLKMLGSADDEDEDDMEDGERP